VRKDKKSSRRLSRKSIQKMLNSGSISVEHFGEIAPHLLEAARRSERFSSDELKIRINCRDDD
jgi:hypothetical protein